MADPIPQQIPAGYGLFTLVMKSIYGPKLFSFNLGYKSTYAPGDNHAQDIWDAISDTGNPFAPANYTDRYTVTLAHAVYQDDPDAYMMEFPINVAGSASWESPPPNTAVLVQKRTGRAGRNQRGRMYIPPTVVSETLVDTLGVIDNTKLGLLNAQWAGFRTSMVAADYTPYLLHGGTKANPTVAPPPTLVTSFLVEPLVATQRRRLR